VDWRHGELVVRGKSRREERLPLPVDVGEALVASLRDRRSATAHVELFGRVRTPHGPLTAGGIRWVVYSACDRAGVVRVGPHVLRHTTATELLRSGLSLSEVAQVLRHRSVDTTAIYAKVDRVALKAVAQPWPGATS
jgi:integrase